jgi:DNA-directed RNA polymerase subunit RPC12/RpoP
MIDYNIYRCVDCLAEFTEPRYSSDGYECPYCGSTYVVIESELDGYEESDYISDDVELFPDLDDIDYGEEDEHAY